MTIKQPISRTRRKRFRPGLTLAIVALALAACNPRGGVQITPEADEPHYRRGLQALRSDQNAIALEAFLKVIEKRGGDAPESHLEAGRLYLNHIHDPIAAIYHFRKYLELRPTGIHAAQVEELKKTAIKEFAQKNVPGNPYETQTERLDLLDQIAKLQGENAALRTEIERIRAQPVIPIVNTPPPQTRSAATTASPSRDWQNATPPDVGPVVRVEPQTQATLAPPQRPAAPPQTSGRTYVVERGDTLVAISRKIYGSPARWREIFEANRDRLNDPGVLNVGTELRLP